MWSFYGLCVVDVECLRFNFLRFCGRFLFRDFLLGRRKGKRRGDKRKTEKRKRKKLHGFHSLNAIEGDFIKTKPRYIEQLMNLIVNVETDQHHLLCKLRKKNVKRKKSPKVQKKIVQIAVDMTWYKHQDASTKHSRKPRKKKRSDHHFFFFS